RIIPMHLLLIDDEVGLRRTLRLTLESMGHRITEAGSAAQALDRLRANRFDLAFLDLKLGRESGLDVLPKLLQADPDLAVVAITACAARDRAVEPTRRGAFAYLPKPFPPAQLRVALDRRQLVQGLQTQVADLEAQVREAQPEADLRTDEPAVRAALDVAFRV